MSIPVYFGTAYRVTVTPPEINIWVDAIEDLDFETAREAARVTLKAERFMPSIAAFREAYRVAAADKAAARERLGFDGKALPPGVAE